MRKLMFYIGAVLLIGFSQCRKKDSDHGVVVTPRDFLSDERYDQLIVEVQYVKGFQPTSSTLDNLRSFLEQYLNKSKGITIVQSEIPSPGKSMYTMNDIREIERVNRTQATHQRTLTAYFFFADNDYAANVGSSKVLGIAYANTSMVIFEKTIQEFSGGVTQPSETALETTVVNHEFAHILGLVNNGTPMAAGHQDQSHGQHCNNRDCLMYYLAETSDIISNIIGTGIPSLDTQCKNDLKANGGK